MRILSYYTWGLYIGQYHRTHNTKQSFDTMLQWYVFPGIAISGHDFNKVYSLPESSRPDISKTLSGVGDGVSVFDISLFVFCAWIECCVSNELYPARYPLYYVSLCITMYYVFCTYLPQHKTSETSFCKHNDKIQMFFVSYKMRRRISLALCCHVMTG